MESAGSTCARAKRLSRTSKDGSTMRKTTGMSTCRRRTVDLVVPGEFPTGRARTHATLNSELCLLEQQERQDEKKKEKEDERN